jgi:DeoR/GlpR family transcriptional regulator of sugar metabolism
VFSAINNGRALVQEIQSTRARWNERVTARSDSSVHRLKEYLLQQPVVNTRIVAEALEVSEVAALKSIDTFVDAGVLMKISGGARYRIWQATEILAALDAFAARARRTHR